MVEESTINQFEQLPNEIISCMLGFLARKNIDTLFSCYYVNRRIHLLVIEFFKKELRLTLQQGNSNEFLSLANINAVFRDEACQYLTQAIDQLIAKVNLTYDKDKQFLGDGNPAKRRKVAESTITKPNKNGLSYLFSVHGFFNEFSRQGGMFSFFKFMHKPDEFGENYIKNFFIKYALGQRFLVIVLYKEYLPAIQWALSLAYIYLFGYKIFSKQLNLDMRRNLDIFDPLVMLKPAIDANCINACALAVIWERYTGKTISSAPVERYRKLAINALWFYALNPRAASIFFNKNNVLANDFQGNALARMLAFGILELNDKLALNPFIQLLASCRKISLSKHTVGNLIAKLGESANQNQLSNQALHQDTAYANYLFNINHLIAILDEHTNFELEMDSNQVIRLVTAAAKCALLCYLSEDKLFVNWSLSEFIILLEAINNMNNEKKHVLVTFKSLIYFATRYEELQLYLSDFITKSPMGSCMDFSLQVAKLNTYHFGIIALKNQASPEFCFFRFMRNIRLLATRFKTYDEFVNFLTNTGLILFSILPESEHEPGLHRGLGEVDLQQSQPMTSVFCCLLMAPGELMRLIIKQPNMINFVRNSIYVKKLLLLPRDHFVLFCELVGDLAFCETLVKTPYALQIFDWVLNDILIFAKHLAVSTCFVPFIERLIEAENASFFSWLQQMNDKNLALGVCRKLIFDGKLKTVANSNIDFSEISSHKNLINTVNDIYQAIAGLPLSQGEHCITQRL